MRDLLTAFLVGVTCGAAFSAIRLPLPAPVTLSGVLGVVGLWVGYVTVRSLASLGDVFGRFL